METELPVGKSRGEAGRCSAAISVRVEAVLHDTDIMYFMYYQRYTAIETPSKQKLFSGPKSS